MYACTNSHSYVMQVTQSFYPLYLLISNMRMLLYLYNIILIFLFVLLA